MKIFRSILLLILVLTSLNAQNAKGELKFYKEINSEDDLKLIFSEINTPIVLINNYTYIPQSPCLPNRNIGGDIEKRDLGGDVEDRFLGGDVENRSIGGDVEKRTIGGDTEDRSIGGNVEQRDLGGDIEQRFIGGDTENRSIGGDTEDRSVGGNVEDRSIGGDVENRSIGGDTEERLLGGAVMQLECGLLGDKTGFRIINPPNADIYFFNGDELIQIKDNRFILD